MKKLILLLFIPLFSFGQDDIDYSSVISIYNYLESKNSDDIMEGLWDSPDVLLGAVMIKKVDEKKYVVIKSAGGLNMGWKTDKSRYNTITLSYGDTLAILEKSIGNKKLFISNRFVVTGSNPKNRIIKKIFTEESVDYPSLSKSTTIKIDPDGYYSSLFSFTQDNKTILIAGSKSFDIDFSRNYVFKDQKEYLTFLIPSLSRSSIFIKKFPEPIFDKTVQNKPKLKQGEWVGNGSGLIISRSGYIITNHHVVKDAEDIEVEFIINGELQKYNAELVQSDKTNDLAIIKIFDMNFDGVKEPPFNFKTTSSDVGTKVFAYGYPMALSLMGKEIKVTDGMINSKTGYGGNVTTYQITAPIQEGNSGGPLFDDKGNFIGINSAGLSKDIADNVGYTIKSSYVLNLIDVLPKSIELPSNTKLQSLPLTEQIKEISKYVVLIKVK